MDDNNNPRQRLILEQQRRVINQETISSKISIPAIEDFNPILSMVADVRAAYLEALFDLAKERDGMPTVEQIRKLQELRVSYTELVDATNALETALERGYISAA